MNLNPGKIRDLIRVKAPFGFSNLFELNAHARGLCMNVADAAGVFAKHVASRGPDGHFETDAFFLKVGEVERERHVIAVMKGIRRDAV